MTMACVLIAVQVPHVEAKQLQLKRDCLSAKCGNENHKHPVGTLSWRQLNDVMAGDCSADLLQICGIIIDNDCVECELKVFMLGVCNYSEMF